MEINIGRIRLWSIYKTSKTNVNADALSRNPINLEEVNCEPIKKHKILNPENTKDAKIVSKLLEESDEKIEEDDEYKLHLSNSEDDDILRIISLRRRRRRERS